MPDLTIEEAGFDYTRLKTYSGYYLDKDKLLKSASGGAVSVISEAIIRQGGVVFGVVYSDDFKRAEYKCAETLDDLEALKGSKYCETVKEIVTETGPRSVYEVLGEKLREGRTVLFVGLGCDVGGAKAYCERSGLDTSRLYTIDILCHGPTTASVHRQYVEGLERDHNSKLKSFTVRYKKEGWTPPYIHAEFENGDVFDTPFYQSDYGAAFSRYSLHGCYSCRFRGADHASDITCGDFWGLIESMSGWNPDGVSIMFVRTPKGEELTDMIDREVYHIESADTAFALSNNRWYYKCRTRDKHYESFDKDLKEKGLNYAVRHIPVPAKDKIRNLIKALACKFDR